MPAVTFYDRVWASTATTGTGAITPGAAVGPFQSFAVVPAGAVFPYELVEGSAWEQGLGTMNGDGTISRAVRKSTNGNAAIALAGSAQIFVTPAAVDLACLTTTAAQAFNGPVSVDGGLQVINGTTAVQALTANGATISGSASINVQTGQAGLVVGGPGAIVSLADRANPNLGVRNYGLYNNAGVLRVYSFDYNIDVATISNLGINTPGNLNAAGIVNGTVVRAGYSGKGYAQLSYAADGTSGGVLQFRDTTDRPLGYITANSNAQVVYVSSNGHLFYADVSVNGAVAATGAISGAGVTSSGQVRSSGSSAQLSFDARDGSTSWTWYAPDGNTAYLYQGGNTGISFGRTGALGATSLNATNATLTKSLGSALDLRSGASGSYVYASLGRTGEDGAWGVAGAAGQFLSDTAAGDIVFRASQRLLLGIGTSGLSTLAITSTGITTPGQVKAATLNLSGLSTYASDSAAGSAGLVSGDLYKTSAGVLMVKS